MFNLVMFFFFFLTAHSPVSIEYFLSKLNDTEFYLVPLGIILNQTKYMWERESYKSNTGTVDTVQ